MFEGCAQAHGARHDAGGPAQAGQRGGTSTDLVGRSAAVSVYLAFPVCPVPVLANAPAWQALHASSVPESSQPPPRLSLLVSSSFPPRLNTRSPCPPFHLIPQRPRAAVLLAGRHREGVGPRALPLLPHPHHAATGAVRQPSSGPRCVGEGWVCGYALRERWGSGLVQRSVLLLELQE